MVNLSRTALKQNVRAFPVDTLYNQCNNEWVPLSLLGFSLLLPLLLLDAELYLGVVLEGAAGLQDQLVDLPVLKVLLQV